MLRSRVSPLRVAVLLALLVPATASVALASSISLTSHFNAGTDVLHDFSFDSGAYSFTLEFDTLHTSADITVTASTVLTETLPPGYQCILIAQTSCIQFSVSESPNLTSPTNFDLYHILIQWTFNTDPQFPNGPGGRVQILHFRDDGSVNNTTIPGSYFAPNEGHPAQCGPNGLLHLLLSHEDYERVCGDNDGDPENDPGVMGQDDSFSIFVPAEAPAVPEPGTFLLLGAGLAAGVIARRRRS